MTVERVPEDDLITAYEYAQTNLRDAVFPQLIVDHVVDDGEEYAALRCPRCGELIGDGDLFAVSPAEQWGPNDYPDDDSFDHRRVQFDSSEFPELEPTLYYRHGDMPGHAVSLPDGWTEDWS